MKGYNAFTRPHTRFTFTQYGGYFIVYRNHRTHAVLTEQSGTVKPVSFTEQALRDELITQVHS